MKQNILQALRLTIISIIFFSGFYTALIWLLAQIGPNKGNGETIRLNGKLVGYALEGQNFTKDNYFWGRPSAVGYNAAGSGASNKGPSNPDYLKDLKTRMDTFLIHNPSVQKKDLPSEILTSSGSGLDPDISIQGAYIQIERVAKSRNMSPDKLKAIIDRHTEGPFLGNLGPSKINVLKLNIDLDNLNLK